MTAINHPEPSATFKTLVNHLKISCYVSSVQQSHCARGNIRDDRTKWIPTDLNLFFSLLMNSRYCSLYLKSFSTKPKELVHGVLC